jgi:hypothetical protein
MRSLLLALSAAVLILAATACSGDQSAEPAPSVPVEPAPGDAADAEAPATSPAAAEEVATEFLEAIGAFDTEGAVTLLAEDADVSGLVSSVALSVPDASVDDFRLLVAWWEAVGYKQMLQPCEQLASSTSGTELRCPFDFQSLRSDEIGLGPYSGSYFDLTVRDGEIVRASQTFGESGFVPQVFDPFYAWVSTAYPDAAAIMFPGGFSDIALTQESIPLWEQRTREYVEEVGKAGGAQPAPEPELSAEPVPAPDYSEDAAWICRPGRDDVCAGSLDITMVSADGSTEVVKVPHASNAPIDCLYVYPTISQDKSANSDLVPGKDEEIFATLSQAARFGSVCDVYVPVYRQITLASLFGEVSPADGVYPAEVAYSDVLDAFEYYVANHSADRGFVLIGHSQGADHLSRLIRDEIAQEPALRDRLVSALILGPPGSVPDIPPCTDRAQVGCLLSYATYDAASPPPGIFGAGPAPCTNPAALEGGRATLKPAFVLGPLSPLGGAGGIPFADAAVAPDITTTWVGYPDFVTGECVDDGTYGYLSATIDADPTDARTDDLAGETLGAEWGLHNIDSNIALDDLVAVVAAQAESYGR